MQAMKVGTDEAIAFKRIMVAVDDGLSAASALRTVAKLAANGAADVALVHIISDETGVGARFNSGATRERNEHRQLGRQVLTEAHESIDGRANVTDELLREGKPDKEILDAARQWNADLLVLGTRGRGRLAEFLLGSTAEAVVRHAVCPVLIVNNSQKKA